MNKEQLIALGLSEEQAQSVLDGFGQMVPKSRLDDKIQELKTAKDQHEAELAETRLTSAVKLALTGKVQDLDIVSSLLDKAKIELDEQGNVKGGLDEQLTTLKESKSFLFVPENEPQQQQPPSWSGGQHNPPGGGNEPANLTEALAAKYN